VLNRSFLLWRKYKHTTIIYHIFKHSVGLYTLYYILLLHLTYRRQYIYILHTLLLRRHSWLIHTHTYIYIYIMSIIDSIQLVSCCPFTRPNCTRISFLWKKNECIEIIVISRAVSFDTSDKILQDSNKSSFLKSSNLLFYNGIVDRALYYYKGIESGNLLRGCALCVCACVCI
jgi:hypothetical protein